MLTFTAASLMDYFYYFSNQRPNLNAALKETHIWRLKDVETSCYRVPASLVSVSIPSYTPKHCSCHDFMQRTAECASWCHSKVSWCKNATKPEWPAWLPSFVKLTAGASNHQILVQSSTYSCIFWGWTKQVLTDRVVYMLKEQSEFWKIL